MSKDKNVHQIDLNKYKDLDGLSVKKMDFGLWLAENRAKITKGLIIFLIVVSAAFFSYTTYGYVKYFLNSSSREDEAAATLINVISQRNLADDLLIKSTQVFRSGDNFDLVSLIKNPNDKFTAHFQICFYNNSQEISCSAGFILPAEEKYIYALGRKIDSGAPQVSAKITSTSWQRIDNHAIPDWASYSNARLNFNYEDIRLAPANESGLSEKIGLDSFEFKVTNRTNYGYYEVPLNISFYSGSELVGVNRYIVKNFLAGESRSVRLSWLGDLPSYARAEIRPDLDILDNSVYLNYQGAK